MSDIFPTLTPAEAARYLELQAARSRPLRLHCYRAIGLGWVRYEIWGIPDGRTGSIGRPVVSNVRKATTYTVYVSTLPKGVREQTEYPANGMDVSVTRVVRNRNGRVIHRETYRSHYTLWNGRIEIGHRVGG